MSSRVEHILREHLPAIIFAWYRTAELAYLDLQAAYLSGDP